MPLSGEYLPSPDADVAAEAEAYETGDWTSATRDKSRYIVLTSVGARTGKLRKTPLMRVEHDGEYAVVASIGGAPKNPLWVYNLRAHPHVELQDGEEKHDYVAREASGADREFWWKHAVGTFPTYADYQRNTERLIPVFVLTRR